MSRPRFVVLLLLVAWCVAARADDVAVDVRARDGEILVDFRATGIFDDDVERALRSGLPARVRLVVELWSAAGWFDSFLLDHRSEHRVLFDVLDERYDVIDDAGEVVLRSPARREIADWLQRVEDLPLCLVEELDPDEKHYVAVKIRLEPLTLEEMRDLERWLRGNLGAEGDESMLTRVSRQLFGVLKGRVGLGERDADGRSSSFFPADLED